MKEHVPFPALPRRGASPFTHVAAVEAWDAWFRWRENGVLRDLTVDATWDRVATALASVEAVDSAAWKQRMIDAFRSWRLLPDERILATAGTGSPDWDLGQPIAVLNATAFVRASHAADAVFDAAGFENVSALATRALDNAVMLIGNGDRIRAGFRIGIIGLADALASLGLALDSGEARAQAAAIAQSLAHGCVRGSLQLARERGATAAATEAWRAQAQARGIAAEVMDEVARIGIRHGQLTAITPQPRLAKFANDVGDALDPGSGTRLVRGAIGRAPPHTSGAAHVPPSHHSTQASPASDHIASHAAMAVAQSELRACIQRWIDEPIAYPLPVEGEASGR